MAPVSYETNFDDAALVPQKGDNCAIATSTLAQGTKLAYGERVLVLDYTVVEGHRFAIAFIPKGGHLLSWGLSFGQAIEDIQPGQSVANDGISEALAISPLKHHPLRHTANFENYIESPPPVDSTSSVLQLSKKSRSTFQGYMRPDGRVGTRNYILILGVSYEVAPLVRAAEKRLKSVTLPHNVTGFCCVGHSETLGGNNDAIVRRCLRNFAAHPNVAYTVLVHSVSDVHVALADELPHATRVSSAGDFDEAVDAICAAAKKQIPKAAQFKRTEVSASKLDIALQCGGSDAFSGISGNPVAGLAAKIAIEEGGRALLAETDELIGAEAYIMKGATPSAQTEFLAIIDRFKDYTARHGHGAEGNPSYGNKLRGLYNIAIKSLGAAMKKHDLVPLEGCVEYGVPMPEKSGYYFMDSPGNDLESIAGQVASGCNVIYFITGNGSITNFPFVPTVKIMTTNNRFQLLKNDVDFNAGRLQLGEPMNQLADDLFQNTLAIASGRCSVGELSGQSQVLIWRDWYIPQGGTPASGHEVSEAPLQADEVVDDIDTANLEYWAYKKNDDYAADDVIVIFGTSLCSGEVALQIAHEVSLRLGRRCVALAHTEGCGCSNGTQQEQLFVSTMVRHCFHRSVAQCIVLEHGCEKTCNAWANQHLGDKVTYFSIQLDGGIRSVKHKVLEWAAQHTCSTLTRTLAPLSTLRIGFISVPAPSPAFAQTAKWYLDVVQCAVVVVGVNIPWQGTALDWAIPPERPGLYSMRSPHRVAFSEMLTGLGGACDVILARSDTRLGHPLIPTVTFVVDAPEWDSAPALVEAIVKAANGDFARNDNVIFQIPRGDDGVSL